MALVGRGPLSLHEHEQIFKKSSPKLHVRFENNIIEMFLE